MWFNATDDLRKMQIHNTCINILKKECRFSYGIALIFVSLHSYNPLCQRGSLLVLFIRLVRLYTCIGNSARIQLYIFQKIK